VEKNLIGIVEMILNPVVEYPTEDTLVTLRERINENRLDSKVKKEVNNEGKN